MTLSMQQKHDLLIRILLRVAVDEASGCWTWQGGTQSKGYGTISAWGTTVYVHRLMWAAFRGLTPAGLFVLHRCDNRRCVNLDHLFLGSPADNHEDMWRKGRAWFFGHHQPPKEIRVHA